jgi:cytochrome b561
MRANEWGRTLAVLIGGIVLSAVATAVLEYVLQPDAALLIRRAMVTPTTSPAWQDIAVRLRHSAFISTCVIAPMAGLIVGMFVGFWQRYYVLRVALLCLAPELAENILADHQRRWSGSLKGLFVFVFYHSLPFVSAIFAATITHSVVKNTRDIAVPTD